MSEMTESEWQGRQVLARGWVTQAQLAQLWPRLAGRPDGSLLSLLVEQGLLADWQAVEIQSQAAPSSGSFMRPSSGSFARPPSSGSFTSPPPSGSLVRPPTPSGPPPSSLPGGRLSGGLALQPGAIVAGYTIVEELSRGGMGVVSRVQAPDGRELAMKTLLGAGAGETAMARFEREAKALSRLAHPGVVSLHDHGIEDGRPWLVMDLVEGPTLREHVRQRGPAPLADAVETLGELARALAYCHEIGVVHRDLKPGNIVLEAQSGRPILLDFGLVKKGDDAALSGFDERLSLTGELIGTPSFMSPEQLEGRADVGAASDVWAFGATMYFLLTGEEPFKGRSQAELQASILNSPPPTPSSRQPDLPPEVDTLCRELLSQDPSGRPSLREVEMRLAELPLAGGGLRLRPILGGALVALLLAALVFGAGALGAAPVIQLLNLPSGPLRPGAVELEGRVVHLGVGKVVCGTISAPVAANGGFRINVSVADGDTSIRLEAFAVGDSEASARLVVPVVCDGVAPTLTLEPIAASTTDVSVKVRCRADEAVELTVLDRSQSLPAGEVVTLELPLQPWRNRLELVATDRAGNVAKSSVEIFREAPLVLTPGEPWPALDKADEGPRVLILKPGEYEVSALLKGAVTIRAEAPGVILNSVPEKDVFELRGGVVQLEGLSIRARGLLERPVPEWQETVDSPTGLRIYEGEARVRSCTFESEGGDGISLAGKGSSLIVEKCRFQDVHWTGVYVEQSATATIRECGFERSNIGVWAQLRAHAGVMDCQASDLRQFGCLAKDHGGLKLSNVNVKRAAGAAFVAYGDARLEGVKLHAEDSMGGLNLSKRSVGTIRGLTIKATKNNAVVIDGARLTLTGALIEEAGLNGILMHALASLQATDLTISGTKFCGLGLKTRANAIVRDLVIKDTGDSGLIVVDKSYVWLSGGRIEATGLHGVHINRAAAADLLQVTIGPCDGAAIRLADGELRVFEVKKVGKTRGLVKTSKRWQVMKAAFKPRDPMRVGQNRGNKVVVPDKSPGKAEDGG